MALFLLRGVVRMIFMVLLLLFAARALLSWFQDTDHDVISNLYELTCALTEPLIIPVRAFLERIGIGGGMFDWSFMITYLLIFILSMFF